MEAANMAWWRKTVKIEGKRGMGRERRREGGAREERGRREEGSRRHDEVGKERRWRKKRAEG